MGTWGTGIFQSDYALDVKDTYMDRIRKGEDDESVMNSLIAEYEREGDCNYDDTRYVFWLALAYIQWKTGRLDPMVKERALSCIQDGSELELWKGETETTYRHRKRHWQIWRKLCFPRSEKGRFTDNPRTIIADGK